MTDDVRPQPTVVARTLEEDIRRVLNRHSVENTSNTPDFILARFMLYTLVAAENLINERHKWWGYPDPWAQAVSDIMPEDPADTPGDAERLAKLRARIERIANTVPDRETHKVLIPQEEVTDGEMLEAMGTDAQLWAAEFARLREGVEDPNDRGWLIAWFANAIEAGRAAGWEAHVQKIREEPRPSYPPSAADLD